MTPCPYVLYGDENVRTALRRLHHHAVHSMPVVDRNGCFLGMFGVRSLLRGLLPTSAVMPNGLPDLSFLHESLDALRTRLDQVLTDPVVATLDKEQLDETPHCTPDTSLPELFLLLHKTHSTLPVLVMEGNDHRLEGIVSEWDILERVGLRLLDTDDAEAESRPSGLETTACELPSRQ